MFPVNKTFYKEYFEESNSSEKIYLLSEQEAMEAWANKVSRDSKSYFDLADDNWLVAGEYKKLGEWRTAYDKNQIEWVSNILRAHHNWKDNTTVLFLINRKNVFQLSWHDFLLNWDCFLTIEDDCPVLIPLVNCRKEAILFQHLGAVYTISEASDPDRLSASRRAVDNSIMVSV